MITSVSDPHINFYASRADSVHRFSQIKRKPPPKEPISFRYSAADLQDPLAPIWEIRNHFGDNLELSNNHVLPRPPTPSDDGHDFWSSLHNSDSESEGKLPPPKALRQRPRAHTVPSKRFSRLIRVPPPPVDIDLLTARSSGALRPASLPGQTIIYPDTAPTVFVDSVDDDVPPPHPAVAENDILPASSLDPAHKLKTKKSFRKSTFGFMEKRKSTAGRSRNVSVSSISAPIIQPPSPRKYSVVSMASTNNASMISLSAFPQPPENVPPVPHLPDSYNPPKLDLPSLRSYILHADPVPTSEISDVAQVAKVEVVTNSELDNLQGGLSEQQPPEVEGAGTLQGLAPQSTSSRPALAQATSSHTLQVDPPLNPSGSGSLALVPKGKSAMRSSVSQPKGGSRAVHFDFGEPPDFDGFDETQLPNQRQLEEAAALPVISESGVRVAFGSLWQGQKTIVCFIRHFWCPLCQDYMFSISQNVSPEVLRSAGIELVIISNGSYEMIKSYRRIFRTPFALYTDPTHKVYNALGMTLQTMDKGPKGNYVRHGLMSGIGMVVVNAVKVGMPVWKEGGDISQLGGEFIFGPGMTCSWVHRMRYTRSHVPILQVIEAAGVDMYSPLHRAASLSGGSFLGMSSEEESKWMERRRKVLKKLRGKKMSRRGGTQWIDTASTTTASSSNRSSVGSEVAGSLCSWDPSTEQAINVGLMGYETAIIEEAEEEEATEAGSDIKVEAEAEAEEQPHPVDDIPEIESDPPLKVLDDTKSELSDSQDTDSFVSRDYDPSELGMSSATDVESTVDGHSEVDVHFDQIHFDKLISEDSSRPNFSDRGSYSSIGSGFELVVEHHGARFFGLADKRVAMMSEASMSESSLESF